MTVKFSLNGKDTEFDGDGVDFFAAGANKQSSWCTKNPWCDFGWREHYPSVTGFAGYGQNLQRNNLFNGDEAGFLPNGSVGLRARIPIYDGGYTNKFTISAL